MILLNLSLETGAETSGYRRAGFDVISVDDIRTNDLMEVLRSIRGDHALYMGKKVDLIYMSPPSKEPNLLVPALRLLEDVHTPWVVESEPGAPMRKELMLCGSMFGLRCSSHRWYCAQQDIFLYPPGVCDEKSPREKNDSTPPVSFYSYIGWVLLRQLLPAADAI